MQKNKRTVFTPLLLTIGLLLACQPFSGQTFEKIKAGVKTRTLANGMKFIVLERHDAPVVSFHVYADVGSANESYGITGISHLLEHIAFKGTKTIGTTDYHTEAEILSRLDKLYNQIKEEEAKPTPYGPKLEALQENFEEIRLKAKEFVITDEWVDMMMAEGDNSVNAYTSNDATQYVDSLPSNKVEFWMAMTYDRFANAVFREFYKERDVVMEERRLGTEGQPFGRLIEDFLATAFKAHPYGHSVVGHMSDLRNITRQDVEDYFNRFYRASNLTAAIVGDVHAQEVFRLAELYFGRMPEGIRPEPVRTVEPEQWGERRAAVEMPSQPAVIAGYHRPAVTHADHFALEALADVLGTGRSSRLYQVLVKEKRLAIQTGAFNGYPAQKYPHLMAVFAIPAQGRTSRECLDLIDQEIAKIQTESITDEELKKYQRAAVKNLIGRMQSNGSLAALLTEAEAILGGWEKIFEQMEKIQALTLEDVKRVAGLYLVPKNRTIGELVLTKSR